MNDVVRFWEQKTLDELDDAEWESLCDGCGRCCLHKLEDEDTGKIHYTEIACKLLDTTSCQCKRYADRFSQVPDCLSARPITEEKINWLPSSCAYVKVFKGEKLADWHPLISGDPETVHEAGISIARRCWSEIDVPIAEWHLHLID